MKGKSISLAVGLFSMLLTSCVYDHDGLDCMEEGPVTVSFTMAMEQHTPATKADEYTWEDSYPASVGNEFENRIISSSVHVFVYDENGFVDDVKILKWNVNEDGLAEFQGYFDMTSAGEYRFVVIANCTKETYDIAYDGTALLYQGNEPDLDALLFNAPTLSDMTLGTSAVPMWGVASLDIEAGEDAVDLGTVWMLRSLAKVEVALSSELSAQGYAISSAWVNNANIAGYSLPSSWQDISATMELGHDEAFRPYSGAASATKVSFTAEDGRYYIYLPEYDNYDSPSTIGLVLTKDGEEFKTYENGISFCNYVNGLPSEDPFNIVRNHLYRFTVNAIVTGEDLELIITISDWNKFGADYDIIL